MRAHKEAVLPGAATACIALLDPYTHSLRVSNMGDSRLVIFRRGQPVHRTNAMTRGLNMPYTLAHPTFRNTDTHNPATLAESYEFPLHPGDIIVLGGRASRPLPPACMLGLARL